MLCYSIKSNSILNYNSSRQTFYTALFHFNSNSFIGNLQQIICTFTDSMLKIIKEKILIKLLCFERRFRRY